MTPILISIVSLGSWNKKLFTPDWVSSNLFDLPVGTEMKGLVNPVEFEFSFSNKDITVNPKETMLEIRLDKFDHATLETASTVFKKAITLLPHTPIRATGFNVRYKISSEMKGKFVEQIRSNLNISFAGASLAQLRLVKQMGPCALNYVVDNIVKDAFEVTFNFHYETRANLIAASFIDNFVYAQSVFAEK